MKLENISKEELQTMGYDEIAYLVLENNKNKMKLYDLFKAVCEILELPIVEDHITDFFELLSTNKKFVLLENGYWDLAINHIQDIVIEDEEDDTTDEELEDNEDEMNNDMLDNEDDDLYYDDELANDDDDDDDLKDLVIIDDDEVNQE